MSNENRSEQYSSACGQAGLSFVNETDEQFINETLSAIPGWLYEPAALLSVWLIRGLPRLDTPDALIEIGVYAGRYLALLHYAANSPFRKILGIDTFQYLPESETVQALKSALGEHNITLWEANSQFISAESIKSRVGGNPVRFISIDGDHASDAVQNDLRLADALLTDDGVVAADDFLNPIAIGVTEGICSFFQRRDHNLVPFAYAGNKLFLCRPAKVADFGSSTSEFVEKTAQLEALKPTRKLWSIGESFYRQKLFGGYCLILPRGFDI